MIPRRRAQVDPDEFAFIAGILEAGSPPVRAVERFEQAVASRVCRKEAVALSSGRRAMTAILRHIGIAPGDEVIIPAYTLGDLIPLIESLGATVVPADIDPTTFNLTTASVGARITSRTRAILALHLFGAPCPIEEIVALGARHGIPVVEDCAHALGASCRGRPAGSFGYAAFFSFETTKPVNTYGGGMVVTDDTDLASALRAVRTGDRPMLSQFRRKYTAVLAEDILFRTGLAAPFLLLLATPQFQEWMSRFYRRFQHAPPADLEYLPIQAELGLRKLRTLDARTAEREEIALRYRAHLAPEIDLQEVGAGDRSSWYFLVARLPCEAAPIRRALLRHGIDAGVGDEIADDCAARLGRDDCPVVADVHRRALALPMFEGLAEQDLRRVAHTVNRLVARTGTHRNRA